MELLAGFWDIYLQVKFHNRKVEFFKNIPFDDIAQEINVSILQKGDSLNNSDSNVRKLYRKFGYSVKAKKRDIDIGFYDHSEYNHEYLEWRDSALSHLKELYKSKTAREICNVYGVQYTNKIGILLSQSFGGKKLQKRRKKYFNEEFAKKLIIENNLPSRTIRDWRNRKSIPAKYLES